MFMQSRLRTLISYTGLPESGGFSEMGVHPLCYMSLSAKAEKSSTTMSVAG